MMGLKCKIVYVVWDIDQMKPLSATVVLSFFIHSELSPFYGIIREDVKGGLKASFDQYPTSLRHATKGHVQTFSLCSI